MTTVLDDRLTGTGAPPNQDPVHIVRAEDPTYTLCGLLAAPEDLLGEFDPNKSDYCDECIQRLDSYI